MMKKRIFLTGISVISMLIAGDLQAQKDRQSLDESFSRYTTPGQCVTALGRLTSQYWRDKRPDTVYHGPEKDSIPSPVVAHGYKCAGKITAAGIPEGELLNMAQLYWMIGDNDNAAAVLSRLLSSERAKDPDNRAWILMRIVASALGAKPAREDVAWSYMKQLEDLGKEAAVYRMFANTTAFNYLFGTGRVEEANKHTAASIQASREFNRNDLLDWAFSIANVGVSASEVRSMSLGANAALGLIDSVETAVLPTRPGGSQERERLENTFRYGRLPYEKMETSAERIVADKWYNLGIGDTILPAPGTPTIVVMASHSCGANCYPMYSTLKRIYDDYSSRGLKVVILGSTTGFYRNRLIEAAPEADSSGRYFVDFLKLPGVVAMTQSEYMKIPDGRRRNNPSINRRNYSAGRSAVLVSSQGVVTFLVNAESNRERVIRQMLDTMY